MYGKCIGASYFWSITRGGIWWVSQWRDYCTSSCGGWTSLVTIVINCCMYTSTHVYSTWKLVDLHKSKQSKAMQLTRTSLFPWKMIKELLRCDSNP